MSVFGINLVYNGTCKGLVGNDDVHHICLTLLLFYWIFCIIYLSHLKANPNSYIYNLKISLSLYIYIPFRITPTVFDGFNERNYVILLFPSGSVILNVFANWQ